MFADVRGLLDIYPFIMHGIAKIAQLYNQPLLKAPSLSAHPSHVTLSRVVSVGTRAPTIPLAKLKSTCCTTSWPVAYEAGLFLIIRKITL